MIEVVASAGLHHKQSTVNGQPPCAGVVKMRRGETAKATVSLDDMIDVYRGFRFYAAQMRFKAARAGGDAVVRTTTLERLQSLDIMVVVNMKKVRFWSISRA